ncbi:MAG: phosphatase PAP2 family protein [Oscillospiraceae bacterium]|nr:phosphatase PAP2 family protein [Oscillospiraceae bacterium]
MKSLTKKQKNLQAVFIFVTGFIISCALLAVAAKYDLEINHKLYNPTHLLAMFAEFFGFWPLYLPAALFGFSLAANVTYKPVVRWLGRLLIVLTFGGLFYAAVHYAQKRNVLVSFTPLYAILLSLAVSAALCALPLLVRIDISVAIRLRFMGLFGLCYMAADNIVINIIKMIVGRARYDDMLLADGFESFSMWYKIGGTGGTSLPSGHTAAATGILLLLLLCSLFKSCEGEEKNWAFVAYAYITLVAIGRIMMGRHFLSDTVIATVIMSVVFFLMTHNAVYDKALQKALAQAQKVNPSPK